MAAQAGRKFALTTPDSTGKYQVVGGGKTTSFKINSKFADVTNKSSAQTFGSRGVWQELLGVVSSVELKGAGIFKDTVSEDLCLGYALLLVQKPFRIVFENNSYFDGLFVITTLEYTGEFNGGRQYNMGLKSCNEVNFYPSTGIDN